jgi:hypothetical protein
MNMAELPVYIPLLFATLVLTVAMLWLVGIHRAATAAEYTASKSRSLLNRFTLVLLAWLGLTGILAMNGFYLDSQSMPPKIMLVVLPALILSIVLSRTKTATRLLAAIEPDFIVGAQSFRLGVEIIFYFLLINHGMPEMMTFEGRNMDISVGITALPMAIMHKRGKISDRTLRIWNYVGLAILLNVMIHGMLSAPTPFQQIVTTPVNNFMMHFPFIWLIAFLVPTALTGHLLSLRQLSLRRAQKRAIAIA